MKRLISATLLIILVLTFAACTDQKSEDSIGIRGEVTSITTEKGYISMLVEGKTEDDTEYDKASVKVNADTKVVKVQGDGQTEADMLDIELFDVVEVVFDGPVAESYPVQGTAELVRIVSEKSIE